MIYLFLLDLLIYNVTTYNVPLFLLLLPTQKTFKIPFIIFMFLTFFEYRYILLLLITFIIYSINKLLNKHLQDNTLTYILKLSCTYISYFALIYLVKYLLLLI